MSNWSAGKKRALMRKRGTENAREERIADRSWIQRETPPARVTKAEMRAETEKLVAEFYAKKAALGPE